MGALPPPPPRVPGRAVWWHAPFFSGSGMGTEALQLVLGLDKFTEYAGRWAPGTDGWVEGCLSRCASSYRAVCKPARALAGVHPIFHVAARM